MRSYASKNEERDRQFGLSQSMRPVSKENSANRIVVTTTISSDGGNEFSPLAHLGAPTYLPSSGLSSFAHPWQEVAADGKIIMLRVGPRTFLGLTSNRRRINPLQIDDHLFIFTPHENPLVHLADLVAELIRSLPADMPLPQVRSRIEEIATALHRA